MIVGAGTVLIPRLSVVSGPLFYTVMGIVLAFAGAVFVMMGSVEMAKDAAKQVKQTDE